MFESNTVPFEAYFADSARIENNVFTEFGLYSGPYADWWYDSGIRLINTENVEVLNNTFSGYSPDGLLLVDQSYNVSLRGNTFEIEIHGLLYGVDAVDIGFTSYFAAVQFRSCSDVQITGNQFTSNEVDYTTPWTYFNHNDDVMCLAGNRFGTLN